MDFCQLLHKAQKNDKNTSPGSRCYSTKFEPPKKIQKQRKDLSDNIKKFLAKKEAEEQKKAVEAQRKKEDLLALRAQDKKATRRVTVMLKRTKSANQAVIEDAVDNQHTAVTRAGPDQPDEDDYGYVSQEATAFYEKMMEKYKKMPEEPKFNMFKKKVGTNLSSTKDRVKAALEKEKEEALHPHRRKRKRKETGEPAEEESKEEEKSEDSQPAKKEPPPKPKPRPAPPPMSFSDLLKIAEKKQFEPILIEQKPKDDEKLLTKKQRKEAEREREWRERREGRRSPPRESEKVAASNKTNTKNNDTKLSTTERDTPKARTLEKPISRPPTSDRIPSKQPKPSSSGDTYKQALSVDNRQSKLSSHQKPNSHSDHGPPKPKPEASNSIKSGSTKTPSKIPDSRSVAQKPASSATSRDANLKKAAPMVVGKLNGAVRPKEFPPKDLAHKKGPLQGRPKEFPPRDLKPKQFPPPDVRRNGFGKKKPVVPSRGRILDDDDEEYDSELDDFIDDGPEEEDNYSSYIKEIFGYDKSRYKDVDEEDDNMETSFAQQMKEEVISTKIGIMEDLEDMKKEEEEKRRKALMKKRR